MSTKAPLSDSLRDLLEQARCCLDGVVSVLYRRSFTGEYVPVLSSSSDKDTELPIISAASDLAAFLHRPHDGAFHITRNSFKDGSLRAGLKAFDTNSLIACQVSSTERGKYYLTVALEGEGPLAGVEALVPLAQRLGDLLLNGGAQSAAIDYEVRDAAFGDGVSAGDACRCTGTLLSATIDGGSFETIVEWLVQSLGRNVSIRIEDTDGRLLATSSQGACLSPVREWLFKPKHLTLLDEFEYSLRPMYVRKGDDVLPGGQLLVPLVENGWLRGVITIAGCFDESAFTWTEFSSLIDEAQFASLYLLRRRESSRSRILRRTLNFVDNERARIALELHDQTSQDLVALKVSIATAQHALDIGQTKQARGMLEDCERIADEILTGVNGISAELRPSELNYLGLRQAIDAAAQSRLDRAGTPYKFVGNALDIHFNTSQETALLTGVVEALSNCARHAQASAVEIDMCNDGRWFTLEVRDDGVGFNVRELLDASDGCGMQGLKTMRDCAESIGGDFWIGSERGTGTIVRFSLPNRVLEGD